jgi:hypothetical protein
VPNQTRAARQPSHARSNHAHPLAALARARPALQSAISVACKYLHQYLDLLGLSICEFTVLLPTHETGGAARGPQRQNRVATARCCLSVGARVALAPRLDVCCVHRGKGGSCARSDLQITNTPGAMLEMWSRPGTS